MTRAKKAFLTIERLSMKKYSLLLVLGCCVSVQLSAMHSCKRLVTVCLAAGKSQSYSKKTQFAEDLRRLPRNISLQELELSRSDNGKRLLLKTRGYKVVKKWYARKQSKCYSDCACIAGCEESHDRNESEE